MADYYLSGTSESGLELVIAPITEDMAAAQNIKGADQSDTFYTKKITPSTD